MNTLTSFINQFETSDDLWMEASDKLYDILCSYKDACKGEAFSNLTDEQLFMFACFVREAENE